jgi:hypothetical protein
MLTINKMLQDMRAVEDNWFMFDRIKDSSDEIKTEYLFTDTANEINEWCSKYCKDEWIMFAGKYYFKNEKDASYFALKWL